MSAQDALNGLSEMGQAAVGYARQGFQVFPCREKTTYGPDLDKSGKPKEHKEKTPYTRHGCHDATTDLAQVIKWWKQYPAAAIGIRTGAESGVFVVDVDTKNEAGGLESWAALQGQHGPAPKTRTVITASGGKHFYYMHPGQGKIIKTDAGRLGPGLDLRGDGNGYVIAAGSTIESGRYTCEHDIQIAEAPEWLLELAVKQPRPERSKPCQPIIATLSTAYGLAALARECEVLATGPEGQRNDLLNRVSYTAGQLVAGGELVEAEATTAVIAAARQCGLDDGEIERTFQSGFQAGLLEPRNAESKVLQMFDSSGAGGADGASPCGPCVPGLHRSENATGAAVQATGAAVQATGADLPFGYAVNANGLHYIDATDADDPVTYRLGPPIEIVGRTRDTESREWGLLLRWRDPDHVQHEWAMPISAIYERGASWLTELASRGWTAEPGPKQRAMITAMFAKAAPAQRVRCVSAVGWHRGCFVMPDAVYGPQGAEPIVLQSCRAANPYQQTGTLAGWQDTIGKWSVGNSRLTLALCVALSGPLLDKVGMGPGGMNLFGGSSSGKTTCLLAGLSVWGGPDSKSSWNSTANGMEGALELHNDAFYTLDEMSEAPGKSISEMVYMLGNGAGKSRANRDGSARRVRKWRCSILSTGEIRVEDKLKAEGQQIRAGHGVRLLELPADAGAGLGCWQNLHGYASGAAFAQAVESAAKEHYGRAGRAFVQGLIDREQDLTIATDLDAFTKAWTPERASGQVVRCIRRFALYAVAGELAATWALVPWASGEATDAIKQCLDAWLLARGTTGDMEQDQAVKLVLAYLSRYGQSRFEDLTTINLGRILDRSGWKRETAEGKTQFVFLPDQLAAILPGLNLKSSVKNLDRAGLLRKNDAGHLTQQISLPEIGRSRCYVIESISDDDATCTASLHRCTATEKEAVQAENLDGPWASPVCTACTAKKSAVCEKLDPKTEGWWAGDVLHVRDRCDGYFYAECPKCQYFINEDCSAITAPF
ncbi:MAG: DUF927 domain-containing protein [Proteobacteria bacterium]|nr:DUF927 domain-containing protein [Pseudomonadota bacterium]